MTQIPAVVVEVVEGSWAIWVHNPNGATVICAHADINVNASIEICIPSVKPNRNLAEDSKARYSKRDIFRAVTVCCTCGGGGPGEKHTCPACEMYHELIKSTAER